MLRFIASLTELTSCKGTSFSWHPVSVAMWSSFHHRGEGQTTSLRRCLTSRPWWSLMDILWCRRRGNVRALPYLTTILSVYALFIVCVLKCMSNSSLTAWGKKLLWSRVVWQLILLYEQAVAGVGTVCWLYAGTSPHRYRWCSVDGTNDVVSGFNHPLQSPPVLGCTQTMPICNISSQDAFYCFSVKVDENLAWEFCSLKFL